MKARNAVILRLVICMVIGVYHLGSTCLRNHPILEHPALKGAASTPHLPENRTGILSRLFRYGRLSLRLGSECVEESGGVLDAAAVLGFGEFVPRGDEPGCGGRVLPFGEVDLCPEEARGLRRH
jgi:hypothetical protein